MDFDRSPFIVFYEITRACDLVCKHCRACAQPQPHRSELTTDQSKALIDQLASFPSKPIVVLTGGDPLKRNDVAELMAHGTSLGLHMSLAPSATDLVTRDRLAELQDAGLKRIAVSIDGADAETHDAFRGVCGTYEAGFRVVRDARSLGLSVQVNTTITRHNVDQVDALADQLAERDIQLWAVFFLVPVGRGLREQRIEPARYEEVFEKLWQAKGKYPFGIKTTEAPFYRRFVMQRGGDPQAGQGRGPLGINDGKGVMFVSHIGQVQPSGFFAKEAGRFPAESVVDVYQNSELFKLLRDPDRLGGKCGVCEYREYCGGSRARAFALTGDPLAEEPDCAYMPDAWRTSVTLGT